MDRGHLPGPAGLQVQTWQREETKAQGRAVYLNNVQVTNPFETDLKQNYCHIQGLVKSIVCRKIVYFLRQ